MSLAEISHITTKNSQAGYDGDILLSVLSSCYQRYVTTQGECDLQGCPMLPWICHMNGTLAWQPLNIEVPFLSLMVDSKQ